MEIAQSLAEAIQSQAPEEIEGAYCIGFVTVAEWLSSDGARYLATVHGDHCGDPLPYWQVDGYLSNAPNESDFKDED